MVHRYIHWDQWGRRNKHVYKFEGAADDHQAELGSFSINDFPTQMPNMPNNSMVSMIMNLKFSLFSLSYFLVHWLQKVGNIQIMNV